MNLECTVFERRTEQDVIHCAIFFPQKNFLKLLIGKNLQEIYVVVVFSTFNTHIEWSKIGSKTLDQKADFSIRCCNGIKLITISLTYHKGKVS